MITDEMVKKALEAWWETGFDATGDKTQQMRAALEAVAPQLIAQGMWEAWKIGVNERDGGHTVPYILGRIRARAQELDPQ